MYAYRLLDTITYRTQSFLLVELPEFGGQFLLPSKKVKRFKRDDGHLIDIPAQIVSEIEQGLRRPLYRVRMLEQRETACAVSVDVGDDEERPCWVPRAVVSFIAHGSSKGATYMRVSKRFEQEFIQRVGLVRHDCA